VLLLFYIAGSCGTDCGPTGGSAWRIEKRDKTTGALVTAFDGDGVVISDLITGTDVAHAITSDSSYIYIAGYCDGEAACGGGTDNAWRIEKRDKTTGALVTAFDGDGIVISDPTTSNDQARAITIDSSYIYIAGYCGTDCGPTGGTAWYIEKRDKTTGALVTAFDGDGIVISDIGTGGDVAHAITIDSSYIYIAGQCDDGSGCAGGC